MLYSPTMVGAVNPTGSIIGMLIGACVQLALLIPMFLLLKNNDGEEFHNILLKSTGKSGFVIAVLYLIYYMMVAVAVACEMSYFMANFTRDYDMIFYLLVISGVALYVAKYGLQTIVRVGFVLFIILVLSIVVIGLAGVSHMNIYNLKPLTDNCWNEIFDGFFRYSSANMEMMLLPVLAPFVKTCVRGTRKAAILAVGVTTLFSTYIMFFSATVLGQYMEKVAYPYFMTLASINLFGMRRMDVLQIYLWLAIAVVKVALFFFVAVHIGKSMAPSGRRKPVFWILAVVMLGTALAIGCSLHYFSALSLIVRNVWVLGFLIAFIPAVILICGAVKRRKKDAQ